MYRLIFTCCSIVTPRAHAQSGVKQSVLSASSSVCLSVCHQNFGLITTTKGLNAPKRHSNNDNSKKKQCMVCLKRSYSREFPAICGRSLVPRLRNSTQIRLGTRLSWPRIHGARIRVQSMSASHSHSTGIVPRR